MKKTTFIKKCVQEAQKKGKKIKYYNFAFHSLMKGRDYYYTYFFHLLYLWRNFYRSYSSS